MSLHDSGWVRLASASASRLMPDWFIDTREARDRIARLREYESSDNPLTAEGIALDWLDQYDVERTRFRLDMPPGQGWSKGL